MTAFWAAALFLVTGLIFLLPLLPAIVEITRRQDIAPLKIEQDHEGNACYFAESFRAYIRDAIVNEDARQTFLMGETNELAKLSAQSTGNLIERVVVCDADIRMPPSLRFDREVYGAASIDGGAGNCYRAVLAEGDLNLAEDTTVLRWAHAERISVGANAALLGRVTAMQSIDIHSPARFKRLHAPIIQFDPPTETIAPTTRRPEKFSRRVVHGDYHAQAGEHVPDSVVANGFAVIGSEAVITGSVKGGSGVRIESGAAVYGSLVSGQHADIGGSCTIAGPVIVEGEVVIGRDAIIGNPANPTTVTATVIRIQSGARIHGSVWAKECGWVEP